MPADPVFRSFTDVFEGRACVHPPSAMPQAMRRCFENVNAFMKRVYDKRKKNAPMPEDRAQRIIVLC